VPQVQAWGDLGLAVYSQLKDMDTVAVVGELRVDYRKVGFYSWLLPRQAEEGRGTAAWLGGGV
jgi:hypothetical protein